jgi:cytochrome oxidase Cu insertion factor (SCO1/SenC/PrrC family)
MKKVSTIIIVFIISLFLSAWELTGANQDPLTAIGADKFNEGTIAPDFSLEDLTGNQVNLADFKGKVVLLNFWATW